MIITERRGYGREVRGNEVHLVQEGGARADGGGGTVQIPGASHRSNG